MYGQNLSLIHDLGFADLTRYAYQEIVTLLHSNRNLVISDLGCGSGIFLQLFNVNNNRLVGVDISPEMIAIAKKRVPTADLVVDSAYSFGLPKSDVVTATGEVLNYCVEQQNPIIVGRWFDKVFSALSLNGIFVFDVMLESNFEDRSYQIMQDTENWTVFMESCEDKVNSTITRQIISFVKQGDQFRKDVEVHRLKLWSENNLKDLLESAGFQVQTQDNYAGCNLERGRKVFICRKA